MTIDLNSRIQEIIECLKEQNKLILELVEIGEKQIEALKIDDIQSINNINAIQEKLGRSLALQEKKRRELVYEIGSILGKDDIRMLDIIFIVPGEDKKELKKLSDNIMENHQKLEETHELSRLLLKQSLKYVQKIMDCIEPQGQKTYGSSGQIERSQVPNSLNKSI
ncbi:flagellar protein FlgN [Desulfitibacter alkalitolerans]|uniref:flagellar protein FlgN n=1 Tax=Desulfitibacter alkalitolerans TaxID=264641 RepID=UPI0004844004|nr:flagellar protein FlgN [Desulfitibacter alkalitolerans]